jgi:hypothetical protein
VVLAGRRAAAAVAVPPEARGRRQSLRAAEAVTRRRAAVSTPAPSPAAVLRSRRRRRHPPPCRGLDAGGRRAACFFAFVYSWPLLCIRFLGQASSRASLGFDGETCWAAANCTALRRAAVSPAPESRGRRAGGDRGPRPSRTSPLDRGAVQRSRRRRPDTLSAVPMADGRRGHHAPYPRLAVVAHSRVAAIRAVPHFLAHAPLLCFLNSGLRARACSDAPSQLPYDLTGYHVAVSARRMRFHGKSRVVIHNRETCF